ncbi:MAG: DUF3089 domain-containing protein [Sphingomonadaceae bacterium]|nr:DUF3089 domain-containing protein [Sphingomonadaceae bacterium]
MARRFLYVIAGLIMLALVGALGWDLFRTQIMRAAFTPATSFRPPREGGAIDYGLAASWWARPDLANDPARWTPPGEQPGASPPAALFFVAPTAYLSRAHWNMPLGDRDADRRAKLFVSGEASAFNNVAAVWAPRYRQATVATFLAESRDGEAALDFAYGDVARAFEAFVAAQPADRPIILAGHSQGSLHLLRLLRERVAGTPLAKRIVAAYLVGWPVSLEADLPAIGLPACTSAGEPGCILSWQSFAEAPNGFGTGTDFSMIRDRFDATTGLTGAPRRGTRMLCVNPLTGAPASAAPASANRGALIPNAALDGATLKPGLAPARCDNSGFLMIGSPPDGYGAYVLPGQNYHVFDYALFWANIRADAAARLANFGKRS